MSIRCVFLFLAFLRDDLNDCCGSFCQCSLGRQDDLWKLKLWHFDKEGERDVAREKEAKVGKGLYCSSVSWQMKRAPICRKHLSPLFLTSNGRKTHFFQRKPQTDAHFIC